MSMDTRRAADSGGLGGADPDPSPASASRGPMSYFINAEEDSGEELDEEEWVPLAARPEWAGFDAGLGSGEPQGRVPVCAVAYTPQQREVLAFFRAVVAAGETSARALALTEQVIHMNLASYTAWEWRWRCVEAAGCAPEALAAEARLLADLAAASPKNYQLWNHRRRLALQRGPAHAAEEMAFAAACLSQDAKNYHAWAHRQAVVASFGLWASELAYAETLIAADVRNNSAWSQRWFVVHGAPGTDPSAVFAREVAFAAAQIRRAPHNESAWAYMRGLPALPGQAAQLAYEPGIPAICLEVLSGDHPSCPPALALLADVYAAQAYAAHAAGDARATAAARAAAALCFQHLLVADPLRGSYWRHCLAQLDASAQGCKKP